MRKQAGIAYFKIDGEQFSVSGDIEAPLSTEQRETIVDITGTVVGYKSTYVAPSIKGTFFFTNEFPIDKVINGSDMTITVEFSNGKVYTLSKSNLVGETPINGSDGTVPLQFDGEKGIWS